MKNFVTQDKQKSFCLSYLKSGILLFFAVWFMLAFLTNLVDLFNNLHLTNQWKFNSGNYLALKSVLHIYNTPDFIFNFLFYCDISIEGLSAILFLIAGFHSLKKQNAWPYINIAFCLSMALWAVFLVMEEAFIAYGFEAVQIRLLSLELISLLAMHLLPD